MKPTTGFEPVTSSLPRKCYYLLSYVGGSAMPTHGPKRETGFEPATLSLEG